MEVLEKLLIEMCVEYYENYKNHKKPNELWQLKTEIESLANVISILK
jgi:hypothetical protein